MPLLYSVVSRGTIILAKHASCPGNFVEVTEQILSKINVKENSKLTYSHSHYLFHYVCEDGLIYLCISEDDFERSRAFGFLNEIKRRFQTTYGRRAQTALPYAMNSDFSMVLAAEMKAFSTDDNKVARMQTQVEDLKNIMVRNIDGLQQRGEKLELLIDRSENLEAGAVSFRTRSHQLERAMCLKNAKITIILVGLAGLVLFIIVTASCGGFTYYKCK